ncbi:carbonic anhydrase family protein [Cytobacillus sp. Sa5YUA1]|uniref:Carbonic anhydrase n=1 Tax=Cytobacillus stercorigallinarum TaxID=2762240 RepID=A0ABR8QVU1_9BACI|nr:carbonic anhydrase family protein [Cytobacillus stercorigallinarum]MBD7939662.1 carbonic anhydrase family protein [Cytobacillus stercorigallinarum]
MKKQIILLGMAVGLLTVAGCSSNDASTGVSASTHEEKSEKAHSEAGHFTYDHQEEWEFVSGEMQSPINITTADVEDFDGEELELNYESIGTSVEDNGHSIQVGLSGEAEINNRLFTLKQCHFHAESEHTIDGTYFPIEAHFVHAAQDGRLAVIGVMLTEGQENKAFQQILDAAKENAEGKENVTIDSFDVQQLLPSNLDYYHYLGSLTTPPLTENVEWYVLTESVEISKEQIEEFNKYYDDNNRDIQDLNGRKVFIEA